MFAQYRKELRSFFHNMVGVTYIALILVLVGIFATAYNFKGSYPTFEYALAQSTFILLLAVPILTMRSISEEKSSKTDQLLYSLPVGLPKIILGKYLAMVTVHAAVTAVLFLYPLVFSFYVKVNFLMTYTGILAFFLLGCTLIAIGMFISSLTENIVLSAIITLGAMMFFYWVDAIAILIPGGDLASFICFGILALAVGAIVYIMTKNSLVSSVTTAVLAASIAIVYLIKPDLFVGLFPTILNTLAIFNRINNFVYMGIFDITSIVYYISISSLFVFLTVRSMEKKRWS